MASINSKNSNIENLISTNDIQKNRFVENFILICLDKNINEYENSIHLFQSFINTIKLFSNPDEFYKFIQQINDEILFIIISGSFGEKIIPEIDIKSQIYSIYIYCNQKENHEKWTKNFQKIKGIYTNLQSIHDAFRRDIRQANNDLISINIFSNEFDQSFICSLLLKNILINNQSNKQIKKKEFIQFSRYYYNNNLIQLNFINNYEKTNYNQISPIQWYTHECFIYSMINRALRLYDIEILNKISFFIQDLHQQIKDLYMKLNDYKNLFVYYSQGISFEKFKKLNININNFISFNNFLLTTIDKELSYKFAKQSQNEILILFQIEINHSNSSFPFIILNELDYYHDTDRYILFSLNSIFRIINIEYIEDKLWQINLILIDDNDNQLKTLINSIEKKFPRSKDFFLLGQLMMKMNDLNKAKNIFEILLKYTTNNNQKELVSIHRILGRIYQKMEDFTNALYHYKECMNIQLSYLSSKDPLLSPTFAGIGAILEKLDNYNQAIEYFQRAVDNSHHASENYQSIIPIYYISIGRNLHKLGKNLEAYKNFEFALKFQQKSRIQNDDLLAEIHHYLMIIS